jgi:hypothetical protein
MIYKLVIEITGDIKPMQIADKFVPNSKISLYDIKGIKHIGRISDIIVIE